jgi:hypothetical protein
VLCCVLRCCSCSNSSGLERDHVTPDEEREAYTYRVKVARGRRRGVGGVERGEGVKGWMDGWMDGWMEGWMDGWMDGWMEGWVDGCRKEGTEGDGSLLVSCLCNNCT